jgi:hypothetical protein
LLLLSSYAVQLLLRNEKLFFIPSKIWSILIARFCGESDHKFPPSRRHLSAKLGPNLWLEGCRMVSATGHRGCLISVF